jgi:hypothetical protein
MNGATVSTSAGLDVAIWFMNGTQITSSAGVGNVSTAWSIIGTGDFNNDGKVTFFCSTPAAMCRCGG